MRARDSTLTYSQSSAPGAVSARGPAALRPEPTSPSPPRKWMSPYACTMHFSTPVFKVQCQVSNLPFPAGVIRIPTTVRLNPIVQGGGFY